MRYKHYNQAVERVIELEEAGELVVLRPQEKLKIGRLEKDLDKLQEIYDRGLEDSRDRLPDLEKYLVN